MIWILAINVTNNQMATAMEAAIVAGHGQWVNNLPIAMQDADASQLLRLQ